MVYVRVNKTQVLQVSIPWRMLESTKHKSYRCVNWPIGLALTLVIRKPVFWVCDQVRHQLGCTATEDGKRLEINF